MESACRGWRRQQITAGTRAAFGARGMWRSKRFAAAIGSRHYLGVNETVIETSLDADRLSFRHQPSVFAAWPRFPQRATAIVLDDELVAEDFGDLPLYGDGTEVRHLCYRRGLQEQNTVRALSLDIAVGAGTTRRARGA